MTKVKRTGHQPRKVDVVLSVTEPANPNETVIVTQSTYSNRNGRAENRAKARERLSRPEGTKVSVIASGESGSFEYLLNRDREPGGPPDGVA